MKKLFLAFLIALLVPGIPLSAAEKKDKGAVGDAVPATVSDEDLQTLRTQLEALGVYEKDIEEKYVGATAREGKKLSTGVYIRHIPTGIEIEVRESKSQSVNSHLARKELLRRLEAKSGADPGPAAEAPPLPVAAPPVAPPEAPLSLEEPTLVYQFPDIPTQVSLGAGYRYYLLNDGPASISETEYEYPSDSVTFTGSLISYPFPHRIYLTADVLNKKDYAGELRYAYSDAILFRWVDTTMFHNLDNIAVLDRGSDTRYTVNQSDPFTEYGVSTAMDTVTLRFKPADFAFHIYGTGERVNTSGERQQRFLLGSGYFDNLERRTRKSDVEWLSQGFTVGLNSHAGPIEFDYAHGERRFEAEGDRVMYDPYAATALRPAGTYPHNLTPDFKSSSDTLKLHSSYSGRLVMSGTLAQASTENEYSGAKSDFLDGSVETVWMPMHELTFMVRYRHKETDTENPSTATITDANNPANTQTYSVRDSLSSKSDTIGGMIRIRPARVLTVNAEYSYKNISRDNADDWKMPSETVKNTASLAFRLRVMRKLTVKAKYVHEQIDAPAYNSEHDYANKGGLSVLWTPVPALLAHAGYDVTYGKRDEVDYVVSDQKVSVSDRTMRSGRGFGILGFGLSRSLSLTTSYAYIETKVDQTLIYENFAASPASISDDNTPYRQKAHVVGAQLNFVPGDQFTLGGGITHTRSHATFSPGASDALQPVSLAEYSELKTRETVYSLTSGYNFRSGFSLEVQYRYSDFKDVLDRPDDYVADGSAHIAMAFLAKRW